MLTGCPNQNSMCILPLGCTWAANGLQIGRHQLPESPVVSSCRLLLCDDIGDPAFVIDNLASLFEFIESLS